jgi:hypothetical protein
MSQTNRPRAGAAWLAALGAYGLLVCGLVWPLPRYFRAHLLGDISGDAGIYVWNLWIFRHELVEHGHLPVSTDHLFTYTDGLDFALHNYTPLAGLLGVPLMGWFGIVGTFNVILMAAMVLSALGVFLLARRVGLSAVYAWSAGAVFIASPVVSARAAEHFSLITAAPLPLFIWALLRAMDTKRIGDAALVGVFVAIATYSDAYYGIYCAMAGVFFAGWKFVSVTRQEARRSPVLAHVLDVCIGVISTVIAWRLLSGSTAVAFGGMRVGLETLYTPVLALTVLAAGRAWLVWRPKVAVHDPDGSLRLLAWRGVLAVAICLALLTPLIAGIANGYLEGRLPQTELHWRSSAPGVDVLGYVIPNPIHPWFGGSTRAWLGVDQGFPEFVASFSLVAFAVIAAGAGMRALPRVWVAFTGVFVLLSAGPFLHVAGVNTYVPGLWAFLRYMPVVGMARSPSRFAVLAVLGLSILFASALRALLGRLAGLKVGAAYARPIAGSVIAIALAMELIPAPRVLYSAEVPEVYKLIAATDDETGRVLELPTGVRDGISSAGRVSAASQYFQTRHHRPLVGGYVSRVSTWRMRENRRAPVLRAIFELSEGRIPSADLISSARAGRDAFLRRTCVRFVVVDKRRASKELRDFARDALKVMLVHEDAAYQLLTPVDPPPCSPRRRKKG